MTAATTPDERWRLGYRPGLDGLRGLAIALVLLGHARIPGWNAAATVGVTLFFVLSGFLITSLLLEERERSGRIDLVAFYKRRARRLLPALFVFLAVIALGLAMAGKGEHIVGLIVPPLLYYANWAIVFGADLPFVGHTWSLAVEEQFYIVWPLLLIGLLALTGYRRLAIGAVAVAVVIAGVRFMVWDPSIADRVARGTDLRADALVAGCLVAFLFAMRGRAVPHWLLAIGVVAVGAAIFMQAGALRYTLLLVLSAAGGAVLVAHGASRNDPILSWRPLVWLGSISYGVYLWQTPAMNIARRMIEPEPLGVVIGIAAAVGLAVVSRRYVEQPFLRRKKPSGPDHQVRDVVEPVGPDVSNADAVPEDHVTGRERAHPRAVGVSRQP